MRLTRHLVTTCFLKHFRNCAFGIFSMEKPVISDNLWALHLTATPNRNKWNSTFWNQVSTYTRLLLRMFFLVIKIRKFTFVASKWCDRERLLCKKNLVSSHSNLVCSSNGADCAAQPCQVMPGDSKRRAQLGHKVSWWRQMPPVQVCRQDLLQLKR